MARQTLIVNCNRHKTSHSVGGSMEGILRVTLLKADKGIGDLSVASDDPRIEAEC